MCTYTVRVIVWWFMWWQLLFCQIGPATEAVSDCENYPTSLTYNTLSVCALWLPRQHKSQIQYYSFPSYITYLYSHNYDLMFLSFSQRVKIPQQHGLHDQRQRQRRQCLRELRTSVSRGLVVQVLSFVQSERALFPSCRTRWSGSYVE